MTLLDKFRSWTTRISKSRSVVQDEPIIRQLTHQTVKQMVGLEQKCLVYTAGQLVQVTTPGTGYQLRNGETAWVVPASDFVVTASCEFRSPNNEHTAQEESQGETDTLMIDLVLRIEPDATWYCWLKERATVSLQEVELFVSSEFSNLVVLLGYQIQQLLDADEEQRERLRAKVSLVFQQFGFRCTGINNIRQRVSETVMNQVETNVILDECGDDVIRPQACVIQSADAHQPKATFATDAEVELLKTDEQTQNAKHWDSFRADMEQAGWKADVDDTVEVVKPGEQWLDKKITSQGAMKRLCQISEMTRKKAVGQQVSGRLRRLRKLADTEEIDLSDLEEASINDITEHKKRDHIEITIRPGGDWSILRRWKVDQRMHQHLAQQIHRMQGSVTRLQQQVSPASQATLLAGLRELRQMLDLTRQLLETSPVLHASKRDFRPDSRKIKQLVQCTSRACTTSQVAREHMEELGRTEDLSSAEIENKLDACKGTLLLLESELRERRRVYR